MSLSDAEHKEANEANGDDGFKAIDVGSLESFNEEVSQKPSESEPDYDRFKLLFDPAELEKEDVNFDALYEFSKEIKQELFEPLIEGTGVNGASQAQDTETADEKDVAEVEKVPEVSPEELGFEKGFEKGLAQGRATGEAEGEAKGYEKGFEQGKAEGMKAGETEGLSKGEAEGKEKGREEGRQEAQAEVQEEMAQVIPPLKEALETADQLLDRLLKRYESQIIELVYQIAEKAVLAKLETDEEVVKHTVLDALKQLVTPEEITLSVSTEDYEYVEMIKEEFFESVRSLKHIAVTSDPMIAKGGCRIESSSAAISTDPESKLKAVYDAIVEASRS
ncbi:MAG: flagellar biosynthesis/type III secretory pathway protein [Desulfobacterales bacterium]|nr:flagellar biosynthesis/type III secretory pathway protein [Desulfobacterales bacterium]